MGVIHHNGNDYFSNIPLPQDEITILSTGWSGSTELVDGANYYTYTQSLATVATPHPDISIGAVGTLPTAAEKAAYSCVDYVTANNSPRQLKLYAQTKPTDDFVMAVTGIAVDDSATITYPAICNLTKV